jgi:hypothetical protein
MHADVGEVDGERVLHGRERREEEDVSEEAGTGAGRSRTWQRPRCGSTKLCLPTVSRPSRMERRRRCELAKRGRQRRKERRQRAAAGGKEARVLS